MILLDSNIWIYLLNQEAPENKAVDRRLAQPLREETVLIPTLVQTEVLHYITRQLRTEKASVINAFLSFPGEVLDLSVGTVQAGARVLLEHGDLGIGGRDAMLLASAQISRALLVTHDAAVSRAAKRSGISSWDPVLVPRSKA